MRILIVEDDKRLALNWMGCLSEEGYAVDVAHDGPEGARLGTENPYQLIVLDVVLPGKNGVEVCRDLRRRKIQAPILMLTGHATAVGDKVTGLDCGADEYLVKPVPVIELLARIRALLRRDPGLIREELRAGDLLLDLAARVAWKGQTRIELPKKEFSILEYLMRNAHAVVTRRMIEQSVWPLSLDSRSNLVDCHIKNLRAKIDSGCGESLIETIRGVGYRFRSP